MKSRGDEWSIKIFNSSQNLNECSLARALQIFALLASSQSKFFISAPARKKKAVLGMLANARKDHSSPHEKDLAAMNSTVFWCLLVVLLFSFWLYCIHNLLSRE